MTFTANATQYPADARPRGERLRNPRHAFRLTIGPGQVAWLGCESLDVEQLPTGAVFIDAPLAENGLASITITPGITSKQSTFSGGTYRFLDDTGALGTWLATKAANGFQMFNRTIEQFDLSERDLLDDPDTLDRRLRYTMQVRKSMKVDGAVIAFQCEDVQRNIDVDVFAPPPFRLKRTLSANENALAILTLPTASIPGSDWSFDFGSDYRVHPGERRMILRLGSGTDVEYISCTGLRDDEYSEDGIPVTTLENPVRGLFGTQVLRHEVSLDTTEENAPLVHVVAYAEEDPASLALGLICNQFMDGRVWPFGAGLAVESVDRASFAAASSERRMTLRKHKKEKAKDYLEEQVISRMPAVIVPDPRGRLRLVPFSFYGSPTTAAVLDETTCYGGDLGELVIDDSDVRYPLTLAWDPHPVTGEYRQETVWDDTVAAIESGVLDNPIPITYESELLTTGRSTETFIRSIGGGLHARHALPVKRLSVKPTRELWHMLPGESVTIRHKIRDYINGTGQVADIDADAIIASVSDDQNNQSVTWKLVVFQSPAPSIIGGSEPLPVEAFTEGGTPLPGVVNGTATNVTLELSRKYYHLDDVLYPANWSPTFTGSGDLIIWHRGVYEIAAQIDLSGRGGDAAQSGFHVAPPASGAWTAYAEYFTNSSGDPQSITDVYVTSFPAPYDIRARAGDIPETVSVEEGRLVGMPRTLSGSGGQSGELSRVYGRLDIGGFYAGGNATVTGSAGGKPGGGLQFVGAAGSGFTGSGSINTSGEDGDAPTYRSDVRGYGASGAGGARGHCSFLTYGVGTLVLVDESRLTAQNGLSILQGERVESADVRLRQGRPNWRGRYDPPQNAVNYWRFSHSVGHIPTSQRVSDADYRDSFDAFFARQRDGMVRLFVSEVDPSDANFADMRITEDQVQNGGNFPLARIFDVGGWRAFDWTEPFSNVYAGLIALYRESGGTTLFGTPERPEFFSDGDAWRDPVTGTVYILRTNGEDEPWAIDDAPFGDIRTWDYRFARQRIEGDRWRIDTKFGPARLPFFPGSGGVDTGGGGGGGSTGPDPFGPVDTLEILSPSGSTEARLSWNEQFTVEKYNIERRLGTGGQWAYRTTTTGGATAFIDTGLTTAATYFYRVAAIRDDGAGGEEISPYGPSVSIIIGGGAGGSTGGAPSVPTGLIVDPLDSSRIQAVWFGVDGAESFRVQRSADPGGPWTIVGTPTNQVYTDVGLSPGATWWYRVAAVNGGLSSAYTSPASATTDGGTIADFGPVRNVTAVLSDTSITVGWDTQSEATSYNIERTFDAGPWDYLTSDPSPPYVDGPLAEGDYQYRVVAVRGVGAEAEFSTAGDFSIVITVGPPTGGGGGGGGETLLPPTNVSASVYSTTSMELFWTPATVGDGYEVARDGIWTNAIVKSGRTTTGHYLSGLLPATSYTWHIRTYATDGTRSSAVIIEATTNA